MISGNDLDIHERRAPVKSLISTAEPPPDTAQIAVDLVAFWEGIDSEVKSEVSTQAIINSLINGVSLVLIAFMQGVPIGAPYAILWHPRILSPFGSPEVIRAAVDEIICGDLAASFST